MDERLLIRLERVAIGHGAAPFLTDIDLSLDRGAFLGLVGPNGAGKSTLLQAMLGIIRPLGGRITRRPALHLGYVPQRLRVDPIFPLTALEVVRSGGMGPKRTGNRGSNLAPATKAQARAALQQLGVAALANRPLRDLSGGQQQRVLIARALVREPELLILDEPTAGMDLPAERELLDFITGLNRENGTGVLLVVHQISLVAGRCSHLALINKDLPLFAWGRAAEMLDERRLSELYRHPMRVAENGEETTVRAARRKTSETASAEKRKTNGRGTTGNAL